MIKVEEVFEALKPVMDPEHPVSITDPQMGIVRPEYIKVEENLLMVRFKPTVPHCPMGGLIGILIRHRLEQVFPRAVVQVKVVPGTHSLEDDVNAIISDNAKYEGIVAQLKAQGML